MYADPSSTGMTLDTTKPVEVYLRLGWVTNMCQVEGPVGLGDGFAFRSKDGKKITRSIEESYGMPYNVGDVVGLHLKFQEIMPVHRSSVPSMSSSSSSTSSSTSSSSSSSTLSSSLLEPEPLPLVLKTVPLPHPRVSCEFYVNGISQGVAYKLVETPKPAPPDVLADVNAATLNIEQKFALSQQQAKRKVVAGYEKYFPAISLYGPGSVTFNPGPNFAHTMPVGAQSYSSLGPAIPEVAALRVLK